MFSQESFEATYGIKFNYEKSKNQKNRSIERYQEIALKSSDEIKFSLIGNKVESKFFLVEKIYKNDRGAKIALALAGYFNQDLYTNLNTKKLVRNNPKLRVLEDEEFLIKSPLYEDWELTKKTKIIQGYKCYKAIGTIDHDNEKKKTKSVTAWFCPSINFRHGPLGFGGLPGLIFYLKIDEITYSLQKIQIKNKTINIDMPLRGKEVTEEEYNKILRKRSNGYR